VDVLNILGDLKPNEARWLEASLPTVLQQAVKAARQNQTAFDEVVRKYKAVTAKPDVVEVLRSKSLLPVETEQPESPTSPTETQPCEESSCPGKVEG